MNKSLSVALAAALGLLAAGVRAADSGARRDVEGWPRAQKQAALVLIEKYGEPDAFSADRLEWRSRGSFKRIVVNGSPNLLGIVEHTVSYDVPPNGVGLMSMESCYVAPNKVADELTAIGGSEAVNTLCLNVADDVMRGRMDVAQASGFQARTLRLRAAGKSSPYFEGLRFAVKPRPAR